MGEARDVLAGLGLDLGAQRLLLGVCRAREREVLPHEQALLVAQVVEVLGLVDPPAPDPQQVHVHRDRLVDPLGVALAGDAVREGIVGDPVGPARPHVLVVDDEREAHAIGVVVHRDAHRAESDAARGGVKNGAVGRGEGDIDVVQRLIAVRARPPQVHGRELDVKRRGRFPRRHDDGFGAIPGGDGEAELLIGGALDVDCDAHDAACALSGAVGKERLCAHGCQARTRPGLEAHGTP